MQSRSIRRRILAATALALAMHGVAAPALDFTLGAGPLQRCGGGARAGLQAASLALLEVAPLLDAADERWDDYRAGSGRNLGIGVAQAELAAPLGKTCVGAIYRLDYRGEASRDLLDAWVASDRRQAFDVGRRYALAADSLYRESAGLKLSRARHLVPAKDWSVSLGLSATLLKALAHREEWLRGSALATSGRYAIGTALRVRTRSDVDPKDFNPFVGRGDPDGHGYGVDLGLRIDAPGGAVLELTAMDAWSALQWKDLPQSRQRLDNQTLRYDQNLNRQAFVQGEDRRVSLDEAFEPRYRAALGIPLRDGLQLRLADDLVQHTHFASLGLGYVAGERAVELDFDLRTRALALRARSGAFALSVTSDAAQPGDASVLGAELQLSRRW